MATDQRVAEVLLRISFDKQGNARVKAGLADVESSIKKVEKATSQVASVASQLSAEYAKVGRQKEIDKIADAAVKAGRKTKDWNVELEKAAANLKKIGASDSEIAGVGQTIGGAANQRSKLSGGLASLGREVRALPAVAIPGAGGLTTDAVGKVTAALASLPPVALPVLGVLGAVGAGFVALEASLSGLKRVTDAAVDANKAYFELLGSGATTEDAQKRLDELNKTIENQETNLATNVNAFATSFEGLQEQIGDAGARFITGLLNISSVDDKLTGQTDELRDSLEANKAEAARLTSELNKNSFAANDAAAALEAYNKKVEEATPRLTQLAEQANSLRQQEAERALEITEDRRIRDEREQDQWDRNRERQETAHLERLAGIDEQGLERLAQIRQQGNDRIAAVEKEILKLNDQKSDIDKKYMESERKEFEKFRKEEEKEAKEANKQRVRRLQDLNNELLDAEESNDVVAFIQAKRKGELDLQRMAEDADEQTQERQAQFDEERKLSEEKHQEELARIDAEIVARFEARKQIELDTQAALEAERARIQQTKDEAQAAFEEQKKLADEDRAYRLKIQDEDDARADAKRKTALDKALADIDAKTRKEAEGLGLVGDAMLKLVNAVRAGALSAIGNILQMGNAPGNPSNAPILGSPGGGGYTPIAFGPGGIATGPTVGMLAERPGFWEAAIPFRPAEGIGAALERLGLGGGSTGPGTVNVNFNGPVGAGVNTAEVRGWVTDVVIRGVAMGIDQARQP